MSARPGTSKYFLVEIGYLVLIMSIKWIPRIECASSDKYDHCLWNAALCKPANFSRFYSHKATPDKAVDGNRLNIYDKESCFHTAKGYDNWWLVDLMDEYLVHRVVLTNRDINRHRIASTAIDLFLSDPRTDPSFPTNNNGIRCAEVVDEFKNTNSFDCASPSYARYVTLSKTIVTNDFFHVCEVEVMVSRKRGDPGCQMGSKYFDIMKNTTVRNGVTIESTVTNSALACVLLCTRTGDLCNGCYWTQGTKVCQTLTVNPYVLGRIDEAMGTDFYVEAKTKCTGEGVWMHA